MFSASILRGRKNLLYMLRDKVGRILTLTPGWLSCRRYEPNILLANNNKLGVTALGKCEHFSEPVHTTLVTLDHHAWQGPPCRIGTHPNLTERCT